VFFPILQPDGQKIYLGQIHYLREHPYFLPCATSGILAFVAFVISFFGFKEVLIQKHSRIIFDLLGYLQTLPSLVAARGRRQLNDLSSGDIIIPNATSKTSLINHGESLDDYGAMNTAEHSQSSSSSNSEHDSSRLESHTPPLLTHGKCPWSADREVCSKEDGHCVVPWSHRLFFSIPSYVIFCSNFG